MAKRYMSFADLQGVTGHYKPYGTLGRHHCVVTPQGENIAVAGSVSGQVVLKPGDTLGYNLGTVWMVPKPDSYRDPIRRVLALAHINQRVLEFSDDPVEWTESYGRSVPNSSADTSTGELPPTIFGVHTKEYISGWNEDDYRTSFGLEYAGAFSRTYRITGGETLVIRTVTNRSETTTSRPSRVSRVIVRTNANRRKVADWLEEELTPEGRERRRLRKEAEDTKKAAELAAQGQRRRAVAKFLDRVYAPGNQNREVIHGERRYSMLLSGGDLFGPSGKVDLLDALRQGIVAAFAKKAGMEIPPELVEKTT